MSLRLFLFNDTPPAYTYTDGPLCPYTTLFRSAAGPGLHHFGRRTPFRFATFHLTLTHGHLGDRIVAKETVHALDNLWQHVLHHRCEAAGDDQTQGAACLLPCGEAD